jgi:hypothetical protein
MNEQIIVSAKKRILFLPHAIKQMSRIDRMISPSDVERCIFEGEVIEEYLDDSRGKSCLVCHIDGRAIHVVCSPKDDYLAIVTAYIPDPKLWSSDFKERMT